MGAGVAVVVVCGKVIGSAGQGGGVGGVGGAWECVCALGKGLLQLAADG